MDYPVFAADSHAYASLIWPTPLKAIKEQYQDDFDYTDAYCAMLVELGNVSMAVNEIKAFLDRHPVTPRAVRPVVDVNSRDCKGM